MDRIAGRADALKPCIDASRRVPAPVPGSFGGCWAFAAHWPSSSHPIVFECASEHRRCRGKERLYQAGTVGAERRLGEGNELLIEAARGCRASR